MTNLQINKNLERIANVIRKSKLQLCNRVFRMESNNRRRYLINM